MERIARKLATLEWPWVVLTLLVIGLLTWLALAELIVVLSKLRFFMSFLGAVAAVALILLRIARVRKRTQSEWV